MSELQTSPGTSANATAADTRSWFAIYTSPRHEKRVADRLLARAMECYLPRYSVLHRWKNGCDMRVELPLFPRYLFVRIDPQERVGVLSVPGVLSLVGGRAPAAVPGSQIDAIREGLVSRNALPHPYVTVGQRVRIARGPLAGAEGIVVRAKNSLRVVLNLDLLMRSMAVEVDLHEIEVAGRLLH